MIPDVISIGGAAYRTSYILKFKSKEAWVKDCMKQHHTAFLDKNPDVREKLFGQFWDMANPKSKKNGDMA